jgi:hypothetical protein
MSQSNYARHRGVSAEAVSQAIKAGRITLVNGKIDQEAADIQWAANTEAQAVGAPRRGRPPKVKTKSPDTGKMTLSKARRADPAEPLDAGEPTPAEYMVSRARREAAEADKAELSAAEEKGQLIRIEAVRAALGGVFSATRDAMLQIPALVWSQTSERARSARRHGSGY